jgi:hypothetical protein
VLADGPERLARGETQDLRRARDLAARLANRLSHLGGHQLCRLFGPRLERRGGPIEERAPARKRQRRPAGLRLVRRGYGRVDIRLVESCASPTTRSGCIGSCFA